MKFEPHLPQLPSLSELLEHPRVKGAVERINRSTVAQRATGFLDELRATVVDRAGRLEVPSVGHLAERLVRRLLGEPAGGGLAINATGVVIGAGDLAPPLADAAAHAMLQLAGEFHHRGGALQQAAERELAQLVGAESALVVNNLEAAIALVLAASSGGRDALLIGGVEQPASNIDWRSLAARNGVALRNVGDTHALETVDAHPAVVLRAPDSEPWLTIEAAAAAAKRFRVPFIDVAPFAGVINPQSHGLGPVETAAERLAAGADLVVIDGGGLLGGPSCGLLVGKRSVIEAATNHPLHRLAAANSLVAAALHATIHAYRDDEQGAVFAIPVWQLLSAPIANLQQRAERLAALIAALPNIDSANAASIESTWLRLGEVERRAADWIIDVHPRDKSAAKVVAELAAASQPIIAAEADGAVRLHLRSLFPRSDQRLVAELERCTA
ncbi:hypothetical protein [Lacipirellula parvula]|uniref:L-seryl-tRNA(Sec) selenium transferase n=1 Tax=Lacipirellula parvula TaxID=2650471 RepID=A0A5K7XDZ3_9BACT|nr:hypothetical protein [Lacipirellula parvula]BBO35064.1 hypothetical protein PLANPX_4676 [Lacipirellula parvula]